jgi:hypothetical protein
MVIEIDGPPMAYFETPDGRITYASYGVKSETPHSAVYFADNTINLIRMELAEKHDRPIIYWRQKPKLEFDEETGFYSIKFRLATYPSLYT